MAVLNRFRTAFRRAPTEDDAVTSALPDSTEENKKDIATDNAAVVNGSDESQPERVSEDVQRGVARVEAVTLAWSKKALIAVFVKYLPPLPTLLRVGLTANLCPSTASGFSTLSMHSRARFSQA